MRAGLTAAAVLLAAVAGGAGRTQQVAPPGAAQGAAGAAVTLETPLVQGALVRGRAAAGVRSLTLEGEPVAVADDGRFVFGLDRDAPATVQLAVTRPGAGGDVVTTETLAVIPRQWNISRLPTLPKYPVPSAEFAARRPGELARIAAARAAESGAGGWRQALRWPLTGRISTRFGSQRVYRNGEAGSFHSGIDIARPTGTPVLAPADGVVVLAADAPFTLEGNLLILDHGMGVSSAFLHLSRIDVAPGERVRQGQPVGLVGMTGRATGPHLHWSLRWRKASLDPLLAAGPMPAN